MINWNVVPMWFGNNFPFTLFTEMEWIGKLAYMYNYLDEKVTGIESDISTINETLSNHTTRIENLEVITDALPTTYLTIADASNTYLSKTDASSTYLSKADASSTYLSKNDAEELYVPLNSYSELWLDYTRFKNSVNTNSAVYFTSLNALSDFTTTISADHIDISNITLDSGFDFLEITAIDDTYGYEVTTTIPITDVTITRSSSGIVYKSNAPAECVRMVVTLTNANTLTIRIYNPSSVVDGTASADNAEISFVNLTYYTNGTYDPTTDEKVELYNKADANGDGVVDSSDAAIILSYYAASQADKETYPQTDAGFTRWYNNKYGTTGDKTLPDVNGNGVADSSDSALILKYYAYIQGSGEENNYTTFWNFING